MMKTFFAGLLVALTLAVAVAPVRAHGEASALSSLSALPVASVVAGSAVAG